MCGPENSPGRHWPAVLVLLAATGLACSQLKFLKSPSVPKPRGDSVTVRGPAFGIASVSAPDPLADWSTYNRTLQGDRYAPFDEITPANVSRLEPICRFPLDEKVTFQTGPLEIGGTLYFTTAATTYAIDAANCALRWKHSYAYAPKPDFDLGVNRGVAYLDGKLFRGANDGRVYALDAGTGRELWNVIAGDVKKGETFPAAPIAWKGLVYIGNAGGDNFGVVGRMMAFDANTGGRVWSVALVAENDSAGLTWPPNTEVIPRAGGATWSSYTLDTLSGTLFVPTGNAAPDFLSAARPGANLHTTSVVELDARVGTLKGWHQLVERDVHDWDVSAAPALITTARGRQLIVAGGKDGHVNGIRAEIGTPGVPHRRDPDRKRRCSAHRGRHPLLSRDRGRDRVERAEFPTGHQHDLRERDRMVHHGQGRFGGEASGEGCPALDRILRAHASLRGAGQCLGRLGYGTRRRRWQHSMAVPVAHTDGGRRNRHRGWTGLYR